MGVAVCVGSGSELGVLSAIPTSGTGETSCTASLSCPQAKGEVATARQVAIAILRAMIRGLFLIYGTLNDAVAAASAYLLTQMGVSTSGEACGAVFFKQQVELLDRHLEGYTEGL